jgi:hypothetical protein
MTLGQSPAKTNLFAWLRDAKVTERGTFLQPGRYTVKVKRALWKRTRKNYDAFILEFGIITSEVVGTNAVGSTASFFQNCSDPAVGFGSLKGFCAAITGSNAEDPKFVEEVEPFLTSVVQDNALEGWLLPLEVVVIKTKAGGDFSLHKWGRKIDESAGQ